MADILHQVTIDAKPQQVYEALTTQKGLSSWWTVDTEAVPELGSTAIFGFYDRSVVFRMRIEELIPSVEVRWSCVGDDPEWTGTKLSWILSNENNSTKVSFSHTDWRSIDGVYRMCNTTWGQLMQNLKEYVEIRKVNPYFK